jgi:hypothetical protein
VLDWVWVVSLASTALELSLLCLGINGIIKHAQEHQRLQVGCSQAYELADSILCRLYKRHARIRLAVKGGFTFVAIWMLYTGLPDFVHSQDYIGSLFFRLTLNAMALALAWESKEAHADRFDLQQTLQVAEKGSTYGRRNP